MPYTKRARDQSLRPVCSVPWGSITGFLEAAVFRASDSCGKVWKETTGVFYCFGLQKHGDCVSEHNNDSFFSLLFYLHPETAFENPVAGSPRLHARALHQAASNQMTANWFSRGKQTGRRKEDTWSVLANPFSLTYLFHSDLHFHHLHLHLLCLDYLRADCFCTGPGRRSRSHLEG